MTGWAVSKFNAVRFNASSLLLALGKFALIRGLMARCSNTGFMRTQGAVNTAAASRESWHTVIPACHAPSETPHNATAGQPSPRSQPVKARISAIACAVACTSLKAIRVAERTAYLAGTALKVVRRHQ